MPRLRSLRDLADCWVAINRLENQADRTYRRLVASLFDDATDALALLKVKEVLEQLGAAADLDQRLP